MLKRRRSLAGDWTNTQAWTQEASIPTRVYPGGAGCRLSAKAGPLPRRPTPPRPVHPLLAGQGSNVDGTVGGGSHKRGGWPNESGTPQFHPPRPTLPHARCRAPLIRFAGRILTHRRASRHEPSLEQLLAGSSGMCGSLQSTIVFSRRAVPTTCGVSF